MEKEPAGQKKDKAKNPTKFKALYASYRVAAIEEVAHDMCLHFERLHEAGQIYGKDTVPEDMVYISLDAGDKSDEYWQKVNEIAAPPTADEIASGKYLR